MYVSKREKLNFPKHLGQIKVHLDFIFLYFLLPLQTNINITQMMYLSNVDVF